MRAVPQIVFSLLSYSPCRPRLSCGTGRDPSPSWRICPGRYRLRLAVVRRAMHDLPRRERRHCGGVDLRSGKFRNA